MIYKKSGQLITLILILVMCLYIFVSCGAKLSIPDEYDYDLADYVKVGNYKGLEYTPSDTTVSDSDIQAEINEKLEETCETKKVKDGIVTGESNVNIAYSGSINGKKFEGGTSESADLDIDNSNFIEGFAEQLVGHSVGENFDINVTFPEDYTSTDLAGKDAVFNITINYINESVKPVFNDKWVSENSEYKTTEEYEKNIEESLVKEKKTDALANDRSAVFDQILKNSEVLKYPEKEKSSKIEKLSAVIKKQAESSGIDFETYISQNYGMDEDQFNNELSKQIESTIKIEMILYVIADKEGIDISLDDYNAFIDKLLDDSGLDRESFEANNGASIEEYAEENDLYTSCLYQTVMDKIMEYSVAK